MYFATYKDLNNNILKNIHKIPQNVDLIVGVPRSGMLVASIIALYLNKPLSDLYSFLNGRIYENGHTKRTDKTEIEINKVKNVLLVEDSVDSGKSITEAKNKLKECNREFSVVTYAVFVRSETTNLVDIYCSVVDDKRMFEWNYLHHSFLSKCCCDIDGVLCLDPTGDENDDGEKYKKFLLNAQPKIIPTRKIKYLVTSRLEKYRNETEEWLKNNGIDYEELIMMNVSTAEERRKLNNHGQFKAEIYNRCKDAILFVESNPKQAFIIASYTGKAVYCTDNQKYYKEKGKYAIKSYIDYKYIRKIKMKRKKISKSIKDILYRIFERSFNVL